MLAQRHRRWGALLFIVFVTRHQLIVTTVFEVKMEWKKDDIFYIVGLYTNFFLTIWVNQYYLYPLSLKMTLGEDLIILTSGVLLHLYWHPSSHFPSFQMDNLSKDTKINLVIFSNKPLLSLVLHSPPEFGSSRYFFVSLSQCE